MNSSIRVPEIGARGFAILVAATAAAWFVVTMPPRAREAPGAPWQPSAGFAEASGVLHVHTRRSDGGGAIEDVARAAAAAGIDFVVVTDHGDATRTPDAPAYRAGVLVIDAVEISTTGGHLLALGLSGPAPFRLAGHPAAVVEDIHRLGGVALASHPDSPRASLAWRDWNVAVDGFEWLNADSEWRDESRLALFDAFLRYWFRAPEVIAALFDDPATTLERWDWLSADGRALVAVAGADAHERLPWRVDTDEIADAGLPVPSYESVFRALSTRVVLDRPLSGDAAADASRIIAALECGRSYSVLDGFARQGALEFSGETAGGAVWMGQHVAAGTLKRLRARVRAPVNAEVLLFRNGEIVARNSGVLLDVTMADVSPAALPAAYRVEVRLAGRDGRAPWIVGNPIFEGYGDAPPAGPPVPAGPVASMPLRPALAAGQIVVERDDASQARLSEAASGSGVLLDYTLGPAASGWVAAAVAVPDALRSHLRPGGWIALALRAAQPVRISVQLRAPSSSHDRRWHQSAYVGVDPVDLVLPVERFEPVARSGAGDTIAAATTLLLVVDGVNSRPGSHGRLWIDAVGVGRGEGLTSAR